MEDNNYNEQINFLMKNHNPIYCSYLLTLKPEIIKIFRFLDKNGWYSSEETEGYISFLHDNCFGIDINEEEILLIDDNGVFLELPCNYYALIGALYVHMKPNFKL